MRRDKANKNKILNRIDLNIHLDDFAFRKLSKDDYQGNLIENADFENDDEYPISWKQKFCCSKRLVSIENKIAGKNKVLKLQLQPGKRIRATAVYSNFMPMQAGSLYEISFDVRADKSEYMVMLRLSKGRRDRPVFLEKSNNAEIAVGKI